MFFCTAPESLRLSVTRHVADSTMELVVGSLDSDPRVDWSASAFCRSDSVVIILLVERAGYSRCAHIVENHETDEDYWSTAGRAWKRVACDLGLAAVPVKRPVLDGSWRLCPVMNHLWNSKTRATANVKVGDEGLAYELRVKRCPYHARADGR